MNMNEQQYLEDHGVSIRAEQSVIGALMHDSDSLDRIPDLQAAHFIRADHQLIFQEICRQVGARQRADAMTVFAALGDKVVDCLKYLLSLHATSGGAANIARHAAIVMDKADKRELVSIGIEMQAMASSAQPAAMCIDTMAGRLDALAQKKTSTDPEWMCDMMGDYMQVLTDRLEGKIKPISTGHVHLDEQLDGGLERGTLTIVAARPAMGKTALGLGIARNVSQDGAALFLSMEMARTQVSDRNVSALGKIPLKWLRKPSEGFGANSPDAAHWTSLSHVIAKAKQMRLDVDCQTGLNMAAIRAKARKTRRKFGQLDALVIDQLSFITGGKSEKSYEVVGEYTRGLIELAKELDCAVVLLCQLNRELEKRPNKRPIMADLAMSGSIEQDAAVIIFLYRDEVYNPDTMDKGVCEVNCGKVRQGEPGVIGMTYIGSQTRFEDLPYRWHARAPAAAPQKSGGGFPGR